MDNNRIHASTLKRQLREQDKYRQTLYDRVLKQCFDMIRQASFSGLGKDFTLFTVPYLMLGEPLYVFEDCLKYVRDELKAHGFKRYRLAPGNLLFISWARDKDKEKAEEEERVNTVPSTEIIINYDPRDPDAEEKVKREIRMLQQKSFSNGRH